jgi:hypothetical protein
MDTQTQLLFFWLNLMLFSSESEPRYVPIQDSRSSAGSDGSAPSSHYTHGQMDSLNQQLSTLGISEGMLPTWATNSEYHSLYNLTVHHRRSGNSRCKFRDWGTSTSTKFLGTSNRFFCASTGTTSTTRLDPAAVQCIDNIFAMAHKLAGISCWDILRTHPATTEPS